MPMDWGGQNFLKHGLCCCNQMEESVPILKANTSNIEELELLYSLASTILGHGQNKG
jgi:hypothetical protein